MKMKLIKITIFQNGRGPINMKIKLFKNFLLTLLLVLSFSTLTFAATTGKQINKQVDGINASIVFSNEIIKPEDTQFTIILRDKNNKPISNAKVEATVQMDKAMGMGADDMNKSKPMMSQLKESNEKGKYIGTAKFTDKGKWNIKTSFTANGQMKSTAFDIDVVSAGPNWGIIGGFLGVIVLAIIVVAMKKKK